MRVLNHYVGVATFFDKVLSEEGIIIDMAIERSIKNLLLLVFAIIIVALLWRIMWFLGGLALFAIVVFFVYQLLKGNH